MARDYNPIRLTLTGAAIEFRVTANKVRAAIKGRDIEPGADGKFSIHDIHSALADSSGLKHKAAEARYQKQIDEAQVARDKVLENKEKLLQRSDVEEFLADLSTVASQIIRHSKLSEQEKALLNRQFTDLKWGKST